MLATPFVLVLFAGIGLYIAYARIKLPDALPQPIQTTYLYDRNGHLITTLHGTVDRTVVPLQQISPHLKDAVIATEDHDFYNHPGVDVAGVLRAAYTDLVKRETVQGASTITEQLVKNVYAGSYTTDETGCSATRCRRVRSRRRSARRCSRSSSNSRSSKDQILANYLNTVYFGHGAYGIQAAAETYFGKPASQLTVLESASLAGVLHAPISTTRSTGRATTGSGANYAIDQMVRYGYLDAKARVRASRTRTCCGTIPDQTQRLVAPGQSEYFAEYVRQTLFDKYGEGEVYAGGMKVTTTLDLGLQAEAENAIKTALPDQATTRRRRSSRWIPGRGRSSRWQAVGTGTRASSTTPPAEEARAASRARRSRRSRSRPRCSRATTRTRTGTARRRSVSRSAPTPASRTGSGTR